jgi:hypothetical protein
MEDELQGNLAYAHCRFMEDDETVGVFGTPVWPRVFV